MRISVNTTITFFSTKPTTLLLISILQRIKMITMTFTLHSSRRLWLYRSTHIQIAGELGEVMKSTHDYDKPHDEPIECPSSLDAIKSNAKCFITDESTLTTVLDEIVFTAKEFNL